MIKRLNSVSPKEKFGKKRKSRNILNFFLIKQTQIKMKVNKPYNFKNCLKNLEKIDLMVFYLLNVDKFTSDNF